MNMKASTVPAVEPIQPPVVPDPPEIEKVKGGPKVRTLYSGFYINKVGGW